MKNIFNNELVKDDLIWRLGNNFKFDYSDSSSSEKYLKRILLESNDLSSNSIELEERCKDWTSSYHLSGRRSLLLKSFDYQKDSNILEVGCGCGAITRFLGETFENVVSIEGSVERARLAALRTRDLKNVSIVNAPFQSLNFKVKFDIIFCIGVFEYSSMFVDATNPHDKVLEIFQNLLTDDGVLILAIENQFGLKYFSSSREDHTHIMFDGIEGYRNQSGSAKTFGLNEISKKIDKYFCNKAVYYPYPDYKFPTCIVSDEMLSKINCSELLNFHNKDINNNPATVTGFLNEDHIINELSKNEIINFFSNSFLFLINKSKNKKVKFNGYGHFYNINRKFEFCTVTRVCGDDNILVDKRLLSGDAFSESKNLKIFNSTSNWIPGKSLNYELNRIFQLDKFDHEAYINLISKWFNFMKNISYLENNKYIIDGIFIDSIFNNCIIINSEINLIDQEWVFKSKIPLNVLLLRAIYHHLEDIINSKYFHNISPFVSRLTYIKDLCSNFGVKITKNEIDRFIEIENIIIDEVYDRRKKLNKLSYKILKIPFLFYIVKSIVLSIKMDLSKLIFNIRSKLKYFKGLKI